MIEKKKVLVAIAGILFLVGLYVVFEVKHIRGLPARTWTQCNLQQIMLALSNYQAEHGTLPPVFSVSSNGQPMHSWRVLILPYLGEEALYGQFRLDEPWNSPHNLRLARHMPRWYRPAIDSPCGENETTLVAVTGGLSVWGPGRTGQMPVDRTPLVISIPGCRVPWTEPKDLFLDDAKGQFPSRLLGELLKSNEPIEFVSGLGPSSTAYDSHGVMRAALLKCLAQRPSDKNEGLYEGL